MWPPPGYRPDLSRHCVSLACRLTIAWYRYSYGWISQGFQTPLQNLSRREEARSPTGSEGSEGSPYLLQRSMCMLSLYPNLLCEVGKPLIKHSELLTWPIIGNPFQFLITHSGWDAFTLEFLFYFSLEFVSKTFGALPFFIHILLQTESLFQTVRKFWGKMFIVCFKITSFPKVEFFSLVT